jgi:hypothetical protein
VRERRDQSGGKGVNAMLSAVRKLLVSTLSRKRHAGALIFRFELTGPIVPYYRRG